MYYISDIPTTNQNLMDSALLVLHDWSCAIALEEEELENERGVVTSESLRTPPQTLRAFRLTFCGSR